MQRALYAWIAAAALVPTASWPAASAQTTHAARPVPNERVAVAWDDVASGTGRVALLSTAAPWQLVTPPLVTARGPLLRAARERLAVVCTEAGTVTLVDLRTWALVAVHDLGPGSRPVDVALVAPELAYVTRADATHLLRLDLGTGATAEVVDLSPFADADGVPDQGTLARHAGRLLVQVRRVSHADPPEPAPRPRLAVVDLATETLVDVDPEAPGVQAIELAGTAPKRGMQVVDATRRLYVGATGGFFDDGGIEEVDLDALRSSGLVVAEARGLVGADLGAFVLVSPARGFLAFSTDFAISSHLSTFTLDGTVEPVPDLYGAVGYVAPALAHAPAAGLVFFPDAGYAATGVHVFDAATGVRLTDRPVATSGPPTDLALVRLPAREAEREPR